MKKLNLVMILLLSLAFAMPACITFAGPKKTTEKSSVQTEKVNVNTATEQQFVTVPGIGPKTAQNIIAYREHNGGFKTIDDLLGVKGIGEKSLKKIKPFLTL